MASKKLYEAMAAELKETREVILTFALNPGLQGINKSGVVSLASAIEDYTRTMALVFKADNERFDYVRFMDACGYKR